MVVARKTPAIPAPPASRTNSSQPIPRSIKGKDPQTLPANEITRPSNGESSGHGSNALAGRTEESLVPRSRHKTKPKNSLKKPRKTTSSLSHIISRILLLVFAIYTLSVCPSDMKLESPICRGLYEYRRLLIEPLVLHPLSKAVAHPTVAPHIARVTPYAVTVQRTVMPLLHRGEQEWNYRVVPQWRKRVLPQWRKHAAPYIRRLDPYRRRALSLYNTHVAPPLSATYLTLQRWKARAEPYVRRSAIKTRQSYRYVKPYLTPTWNHAKVLLVRILDAIFEQRRRFVDPHVARMWEKIVELGSGVPSRAIRAQSRTGFTEPPSEVPFAETVAKTVAIPSIPDETSPPDVEALESASSVIAASAADASSVIPSVMEEIASSIVDATRASPALQQPDINDPDLAELYNELGLDDTNTQSGVTEDAIKDDPVEDGSSEEDFAEQERLRLEKVAQRRADIESRHTKWEHEIEDAASRLASEYITKLQSSRAAALVELRQSVDIRNALDGLAKDAEKLQKGGQAYLKSLIQKDNLRDRERVAMWFKLIAKLEERFLQRVKEVEALVREWYARAVGSEVQEAQDAIDSVKTIANDAQQDTGMDYAWLDDVTVDDWTRYHDLMRRVQDFTELLSSLQNGTHAKAPENPFLLALDELHVEVKDVFLGFQKSVRQLQREGDRTFGTSVEQEENAEEHEREWEEHEPEEWGEETEAKEETPGPQVSILPVPVDEEIADPPIPQLPPFIGRDRAEVLEAFDRYETQRTENARADAGETTGDGFEDVESADVAHHAEP